MSAISKLLQTKLEKKKEGYQKNYWGENEMDEWLEKY